MADWSWAGAQSAHKIAVKNKQPENLKEITTSQYATAAAAQESSQPNPGSAGRTT